MAQLAVIIPTLNERENVQPLVSRLEGVLEGVDWEVVFVDDDSADGTSKRVLELSRTNPRVRLVRRIRRRGLASACLEGMMATTAPFLAVMDGDLQHDESLLPLMLREAQQQSLDMVIASRNLQDGGMGEFAASRVHLSHLGAAIGHLLPGASRLTDPMSGFFLVSREYLERVIYRTSGIGFKILLDLVTASKQPVRFVELPYRFRERTRGASKLDISVGVEYLFLIADKLVGEYIPVRFFAFVLSGLPGLAIHLGVLGILQSVVQLPFHQANVWAVLLAMTSNFFVNNSFTFRAQRLRGARLLRGLLFFYVVCSLGAIASLTLAQFLYEREIPWYMAGVFGMTLASVWNYGASSVLSWRSSRGEE